MSQADASQAHVAPMPDGPLPSEQLAIMRAELERELAENLCQQSLLVTRALVLVAAAGASLGLWTSPHGTFAAIGTLLAIVAAILGVAALWLWKSPAPIYDSSTVRAYLRADTYSILYQLVADLSATVKQRVSDARLKARFITAGFLVMVVSWIMLALAVMTGDTPNGGNMSDDQTQPQAVAAVQTTEPPVALPSAIDAGTLTAGAKPDLISTRMTEPYVPPASASQD